MLKYKLSRYGLKGSCESSKENNLLNKSIELIVDSFIDIHKLSKKDFLKKVFDAAFKLIPEAKKGSFFELQNEVYIPIFSNGYDFETLKKLSFKKSEFFIDYECLDINRIQADQIYISERDNSKFTAEILEIFKNLGTYSDFTSLYAPIQVDGINLGLICLENFSSRGFSENSKKVLTFYAQLISNFYSMKLHQEKEAKMYEDIVTALVSAIEVKDIYTEGHAKRVQAYSIGIAKELGFDKGLVRDISSAALLHDVGKIGIPTKILNKPGSLNTDEFDIIKTHPSFSKKIIEKISNFSNIANYAFNHHERYDGHGYPLGLKGNEIPMAAYVIQLADSFDAMTSDRAYRKALSTKDALFIIKNETGKQFHPEVANAALRHLSKIANNKT